MMTLRKIEIQVDDDWVVTQMKELKEGDIFRMTEPEELIPFGTWIALGDARDDCTGPEDENVWGVDAEVKI